MQNIGFLVIIIVLSILLIATSSMCLNYSAGDNDDKLAYDFSLFTIVTGFLGLIIPGAYAFFVKYDVGNKIYNSSEKMKNTYDQEFSTDKYEATIAAAEVEEAAKEATKEAAEAEEKVVAEEAKAVAEKQRIDFIAKQKAIGDKQNEEKAKAQQAAEAAEVQKTTEVAEAEEVEAPGLNTEDTLLPESEAAYW